MKTKSLKTVTLIMLALLVFTALCSCGTETSSSDLSEMISKIGNEQVLVSFPGLGIEPIVLNKVAFSLFNTINVRWYGILITVGIVLAFVYSYLKSKKEGIKTDDLLDMAIWGVVCAVVGARLYYVLTSLDKFTDFWSIFKIWEGGLAIYGAVIAGAIAIFTVCHIKKIKFLKAFDAIAPSVMMGQIIGRWGNFFNGEAYGYELREGNPLYFLRMGIYPHTGTETGIQASAGSMAYVHPTFLYESVWNILGFILINIIYRKHKKFDGEIFYLYITWYGFGRMFIEMLRTDSLYIFGSIRISVLVGCLCFISGVALLIWGAAKGKKERLANSAYEIEYPNFKKEAAVTADNDAESTPEEDEEAVEDNENEEDLKDVEAVYGEDNENDSGDKKDENN